MVCQLADRWRKALDRASMMPGGWIDDSVVNAVHMRGVSAHGSTVHMDFAEGGDVACNRNCQFQEIDCRDGCVFLSAL